jgi:hypothetical protein
MAENDPDVKTSASTDNGTCINKACDEALMALEDLCSKVPPKLLKSKVKRGIAKGLTSMVKYWKEQGDSVAFPPIG